MDERIDNMNVLFKEKIGMNLGMNWNQFGKNGY